MLKGLRRVQYWEEQRQSHRETGVSLHHGAPIEGTPETPRTVHSSIVMRGWIGTLVSRETPVSRTAILRLYIGCFSTAGCEGVRRGGLTARRGVRNHVAMAGGWITNEPTRLNVHTRKSFLKPFLNQPGIMLYLPCSGWFGSKRMSVWFQINRKMVNTIWFRVDLMRFRKDFSVCSHQIQRLEDAALRS